MKFLFILCALVGALSSLGQGVVTPLNVLRKIPHSGYSEGLDYHEGKLWNPLPKKIQVLDAATGEVVRVVAPATDYSESVVWFQGYLWNVSYSNNGIYRAAPNAKGDLKFERVGSTPENLAWGLAHNGRQLLLTGNYSNKIYFLDAKKLSLAKTLEVSVPKEFHALVSEVKDLEDLAWDGALIWTSSFSQEPLKGTVFSVDPASGQVRGFFSLPNPAECPVIDGIAYHKNRLWITGKECPSVFEVELPKQKSPKAKP